MTRRLFLLAILVILVAIDFQSHTLAAEDNSMSEVQNRIDRVSACLTTVVVEKDAPLPCQSLQSRMAHDRVPGVSIAVIHNGAIEWAQGFGVVEPGGTAVTPDTLFQAGSISKPVAAMAALRLVEHGQLSLDSDVNQALTSWKIPPSSAAPGAIVTLRELLTHAAV
jgi:CubicO group peptidase (beta-lactamase class C family)